MRRAIVLDTPNVDVSACADYGDVVQLFGTHRRRASLWSPDFQAHDLPTALAAIHFNPEEDAVVCVGGIMLCVIAISYLVSQHGKVRVLMYDSIARTYKLTHVGEAHAEVGGRNV